MARILRILQTRCRGRTLSVPGVAEGPPTGSRGNHGNVRNPGTVVALEDARALDREGGHNSLGGQGEAWTLVSRGRAVGRPRASSGSQHEARWPTRETVLGGEVGARPA